MATITELARQYAQRLRSASNKPHEAVTVADEINRITYSETGKPLSRNDKNRIVDEISGFLLGSADKNLKVLAEDNKEYLDLVDEIINRLNS